MYLEFQETLHCFKRQTVKRNSLRFPAIKLRNIKRFTLKVTRRKRNYNKNENNIRPSVAARMLRRQTDAFHRMSWCTTNYVTGATHPGSSPSAHTVVTFQGFL